MPVPLDLQVGAVEPITHIHAGLAHSFERRLLPHDDPSLPETEFELFKKYQVCSVPVFPRAALPRCQDADVTWPDSLVPSPLLCPHDDR